MKYFLYFAVGFFASSFIFMTLDFVYAQEFEIIAPIDDVIVTPIQKSGEFVFDSAIVVTEKCELSVSSTSICVKIEPEYHVFFKNDYEEVRQETISKTRYEKISSVGGALFNPVIFEYSTGIPSRDSKNGDL